MFDLIESEIKVQSLTPKQKLLLETMVEGKSTEAASKQLGVSQRAVQYMLNRIYKNLGVATLVSAIVIYVAYMVERQVRHNIYNAQKVM